MIKVNTHEAKTRLSALLAAVEQKGERVIICRNGKAVAELRPMERKKDPLRLNRRLAKVEIHEDPAAPLEPEDWPDAAL